MTIETLARFSGLVFDSVRIVTIKVMTMPNPVRIVAYCCIHLPLLFARGRFPIQQLLQLVEFLPGFSMLTLGGQPFVVRYQLLSLFQ